MAHYLTNDDRYRDLILDDDPRSYFFDRDDAPIGYRFGRTRGKRARVHARSALRRVSGYFKNLIEAIANAKHGARTRASRHSFRPDERELDDT